MDVTCADITEEKRCENGGVANRRARIVEERLYHVECHLIAGACDLRKCGARSIKWKQSSAFTREPTPIAVYKAQQDTDMQRRAKNKPKISTHEERHRL